MTYVCLVFQVHQPLRLNRNFHLDVFTRRDISKKDLFELYFDNRLNEYVFKRAAQKCYFPANRIILEQIDKFKRERKKFKVTYGVSGVFVEQCERWSPDLLESFKELAQTGCVEFLDEPYYHSLAGLYGDNRSEFIEQVLMHKRLVKELFNYKPKVFVNTECLYNNAIAKTIEELGYEGILTEGVERVLGGRSPNHVYRAKNSALKVLLRNYRLSDDIGFRFSSRDWEQWPLFADKYASWLAATPGQVIVIFMDYETFGEHHWPETGIHEFLRWLPSEVVKWENLSWCTPTEAVRKCPPIDEIDVPEYNTVSWADLERDTSAWIGNPMQYSSYELLKTLEHPVKALGDKDYLKLWRHFQSSDHLYYMSTKAGGSGDVHNYFNPYGGPSEAFVVFSRILSDFEARVLLPARGEFRFFYGFARPTEWAARNLYEFRDALKTLGVESIEFHIQRGDFERWIREVIGDKTLANRIAKVSREKFYGEKLRKKVLAILNARLRELERKINKFSVGGSK